jgi:chromosome segregation ATPase
MSLPHTAMSVLNTEQQMLLTIIQSNCGNRPAYDMFLPQYLKAAERMNSERNQKETILNNEVTSIRTKVDGALGQLAGLNQKVAELDKVLAWLTITVQTENDNYAKVLSHTKSVLATVQNTARDLCTDTDFLRHEMEKIHSTLRIVPNLSTDFKKFEVRLDMAESDIVELKNPPAKKSYNWEVFIIAMFVAVMSWLFAISQKNKVLAIGY